MKGYEITDDFIGTFDEIIPDELCDKYIDYFDNWTQNYNIRNTFKISDTALDTITGGFINESMRLEYVNGPFVNAFFRKVWPLYCDRYNELHHSGKSILDIKIQKTIPGEGYHVWHTENSSLESRNRCCAFMVYLNDVEEGGETEFLYQKRRIKPEKGKLILWPAYYTHVHRGNPPLSGEKYVITGWVEYS